jgi:hypothetical protein
LRRRAIPDHHEGKDLIMADVDKDKSAPAHKPSVEHTMALEAFEMALFKREEARAHPDWVLPIGHPRRRRAQKRFDVACGAVTQARLAYDALRALEAAGVAENTASAPHRRANASPEEEATHNFLDPPTAPS